MSLKLDRKKFWTLYHKSFDAYGPTTQATVDALNDILDRFETETRLKHLSHYSYTLATSYHETGIGGNHFVPVKEGREKSNSPRRANQDRYWKTGFYGRGQTQTTWEDNYRKLGKALGVGELFVENPDLLLTPEWSYEALVYGLSSGMYRKDAKGPKSLSRYLTSDNASLQEYIDARDVVNGDKKTNGLLIATYAEKFENILRASTAPTTSTAAANQPAKNLSASKDAVPTAEQPSSNSGDTVNVAKIENVNVEDPKPQPTGTQTVQKQIPNPITKIIAGITVVTGLGINVGELAQKRIEDMTGRQLGYMAIVLAVVGGALWLWHRSMERANERTKQLVAIASDPSKNNVVIEK